MASLLPLVECAVRMACSQVCITLLSFISYYNTDMISQMQSENVQYLAFYTSQFQTTRLRKLTS